VFITRKRYQELLDTIARLEARIYELEHPKNSNNSSIPPSKDENRVKRNQSLREKSGKRPGAQPGHEGSMLKMTDQPDEIIKRIPQYCECCGMDISELEGNFIERRQVINLPVIKVKYIEHQTYSKVCQCGHITEGKFPKYIKTSIQYGQTIESLISYFYARHYIPFRRMKEIFIDIFGLPISEGGIHYLLKHFTIKALPFYEIIRVKIERSLNVRSDETGAKLNGEKSWFWVWCNDKYTYIVHSGNRSIKTIKDAFPLGFKNAIINHDRWGSQLNTPAKGHQLCTAHLQRDFNYLIELYESEWAAKFKAILKQAIKLKDRLSPIDYLKEIPERDQMEIELDKLLLEEIEPKHKKALSLQKKLNKQRNSILTFLYYPSVPPDNNGSERAIRNVKVKQKVSGYFKSPNGAQTFAINRSIIDTIIKSGNNVLDGLNCLATYIPD